MKVKKQDYKDAKFHCDACKQVYTAGRFVIPSENLVYCTEHYVEHIKESFK